jgi:hypothetical protein
MCFSTSAGIDDLTINEIVFLVEAFTILFDHFFLILFLQREVNCKQYNIDNSENATKVCQELTSWSALLPLECTTCWGLKGHFPYDSSSTLSYQAAVGHLHGLVGMS